MSWITIFNERRAMLRRVATPRCPLCGYFLVAREGPSGPYFYCLCTPPRKRAKVKRRRNRRIVLHQPLRVAA